MRRRRYIRESFDSVYDSTDDIGNNDYDYFDGSDYEGDEWDDLFDDYEDYGYDEWDSYDMIDDYDDDLEYDDGEEWGVGQFPDEDFGVIE